ncbi:MAG: hypothetical protein FJ148_17365 [Deltaproteobacteria bacterium]|nr:hypothetical protein [Deltaproteobacteria bacterium]
MEARAAVREGRRLRTILQDLSDRDALRLYELAGLKPAGSTKAFPFVASDRDCDFTVDDEVGSIEGSAGSWSKFASSDASRKP